jgi:hypothetical protein
MLTMTGAWFAPDGATNVNPRVRVAVRPPDVTTTSTAPAALDAGVVAVIAWLPWTATTDAAIPPIVTVAPLENPLPVMDTAVPPFVLPALGEIAEIDSPVGVGAVDESPQPPAASARATTPTRR